MKRILWFSLLLLWLIHSGCQRDKTPEHARWISYLQEEPPVWVDSLLQSMTLEEKMGQLIFMEWMANDSIPDTMLTYWTRKNYVGGFLPQGLPLSHFVTLSDSLRANADIPLFIASRAKAVQNEQFAGWDQGTSWLGIEDSLVSHLQRLYARQAYHLGINLTFGLQVKYKPKGIDWSTDRSPGLSEYHIISATESFDDYYPQLSDTVLLQASFLQRPKTMVKAGMGGLTAAPDLFEACGTQDGHFQSYLSDHLDYHGLIWSKVDAYTDLLCQWRQGVDQFWVRGQPDRIHHQLVTLVQNGAILQEEVNERVSRVLQAKYWMHHGLEKEAIRDRTTTPIQASLVPRIQHEQEPSFLDAEDLEEHFNGDSWRLFQEKLDLDRIVLVHNGWGSWPLLQTQANSPKVDIIDYCAQPAVHFKNTLEEFITPSYQHGTFSPEKGFQVKTSRGSRPIVLIDGNFIRFPRDTMFLQKLAAQSGILINMGHPEALAGVDTTGLTLLQAPRRARHVEKALAEMVVGALGTQGKLPMAINAQMPAGAGLSYPTVRLGYSRPEFVGFAGEKLLTIDAIVNRAIREKAMPGCQILVARHGRIFYHKAFGEHTYGGVPVHTDHVYDLASITKVAATTVGFMKAYEDGLIDLEDRIRKYLPDLSKGNIAHITTERLLTHRSGIQANVPILNYMRRWDKVHQTCNPYFCSESSEIHSVPVAGNMFFANNYIDSLRKDLNDVRLYNGRRYLYSDANFVLLQLMLEEVTGQPINQWVYEEVYRPMGLEHLLYRPLDKLDKSQIVPTERDMEWRGQLLHGYVHDPAASLLGGVAGHAGLFGNAEDLASLMQMLLNGGNYGGVQYLKPETIEQFTTAKYGNHRGLGFDKPHRTNRSARSSDVSGNTYGHTGFTGTCVWVDPDSDLVFVFLSNRIHPSAQNKALIHSGVRARVHNVVYDALDTYDPSWPDLPYPNDLDEGGLLSQLESNPS